MDKPSTLTKQEARDALAFLVLQDPLRLILHTLNSDSRVFARVALLLHQNGILLSTTLEEVAKSVTAATQEHTVLRGMDVGRSLLARCAYLLGKGFYEIILHWLVDRIRQLGPCLEIDPYKFADEDPAKAEGKVTENATKLGRLILDLFTYLEQLFAPPDAFPHLCHLAGRVAECIDMRFPKVQEGGPTHGQRITLLVLLGPFFYTHVAYSNLHIQRSLIIVSKTFQNLINGIHFGRKEAHMQRLNTYIDQCHGRMSALAARICSVGVSNGIFSLPVVDTDTGELLESIIVSAKRNKNAANDLRQRASVVSRLAQRVSIAELGGRTETIAAWLDLILFAEEKATKLR